MESNFYFSQIKQSNRIILTNQVHGSCHTQELISSDIAADNLPFSRVSGASVQQSPIVEDADRARIQFEMPFVGRRESFARKRLIRLIEALHFALIDVVQCRPIVHIKTEKLSKSFPLFKVPDANADAIPTIFIYRICSGRPFNGFNLMTGATYL